MRLLTRIGQLFTPALVFFAVFSGGGFATGREIVEFILQYGNVAFYSLAIIGVSFFILIFLSIEIARKHKAYNYRAWAKVLLGKYWFIIDILFIILAAIAIAVVSSGASNLIREHISINLILCNVLIFIVIGFVIFFGESIIKLFSSFSAIIFIAIAIYLFIKLIIYDDLEVTELMSTKPSNSKWLLGSFKYISYNVIVIPAILYSFKNITNRRDSLLVSIISSLCLVLPIGLILLILSKGFPEIISSELPLFDVLSSLGIQLLIMFYYIAFLITLLDTSLGLTHAINDRFLSQFQRLDSKKYRVILTFIILFFALLFSYFGIIDLIAKGYSTMSYLFFACCIIPILIVGGKILIGSKKFG